jgi:hypothetical protein
VSKPVPPASACSTTGKPQRAFVYVGSQLESLVEGFDIAADGSAHPLTNGPFTAPGQDMRSLGTCLYIAGAALQSFAIQADGSLLPASDPVIPSFGFRNQSIDRTGTTAYGIQLGSAGTAPESSYAFIALGPDGSITYIGSTLDLGDASLNYQQPLAFSLDNQFAYTADGAFSNEVISGFKRNADQRLTAFPVNVSLPPGAGAHGFAVPEHLIAHPTANFVVAVLDGRSLGAFSVNADGSLQFLSQTTGQSTSPIPDEIAFNPTGDIIATAGQSGIELFSFANGTMTHLQHIDGAFTRLTWDKAGHMLALELAVGSDGLIASPNLHIFTVAQGAATAAPGSPHAISIPHAAFVAVAE